MKRSLLALAIALVGVAVIGLAGGDPRAAASLAAATRTSLAGLALAIALGLGVWAFPKERRSLWLLVPMVMVAVFGALSGWIAGAEILGEPTEPVRLALEPGGVAFLIAMTAAGMALPPLGVSGLARRFRRRPAQHVAR